MPPNGLSGHGRVLIRILIERDLGVGGDNLGDFANRKCNRAVKVVGAQVGHHFTANVAQFGVGKNAFEAVSHFDAALVVAHGQQNQYAAVGAFLADLPLVLKLVGIVGRVIAV